MDETKTYAIKEIFYTLQGEGRNAGKPAVFVRFVGCNLWNGIEEDREKWFGIKGSPCARFCDTEFVGGSKKTAQEILSEIYRLGGNCRFVVFTGGEPTLQLDANLVETLDSEGIFFAIETNGTIDVPFNIGYVTLSPKIPDIKLSRIDELKVIFPSVDPIFYLDLLRKMKKDSTKMMRGGLFENPGRLFIQPEDGPNAKENLRKCLEFLYANPAWRLSLQTHKMIGLR